MKSARAKDFLLLGVANSRSNSWRIIMQRTKGKLTISNLLTKEVMHEIRMGFSVVYAHLALHGAVLAPLYACSSETPGVSP
ncbi:hypothetical protein SUGI_0880100 [Cryptomeria japonica]|nr:hypothetical protein SUGI_0880100 [Cryptomeria japonica]